MGKNDSIMSKIQILIASHFETAEAAFNFFDDDKDGKLSQKEIVRLLKEAEINGFIRGIVSRKIIERYDVSHDDYVNWQEFQDVISAIAETNE